MYDELRATGLVIGAVVGSLLLLGVVAALALARKKRCRMKLRSISFARTGGFGRIGGVPILKLDDGIEATSQATADAHGCFFNTKGFFGTRGSLTRATGCAVALCGACA